MPKALSVLESVFLDMFYIERNCDDKVLGKLVIGIIFAVFNSVTYIIYIEKCFIYS